VAQTVTIGEQKVCPESESLKFSTTPTPTPQVENPSDSDSTVLAGGPCFQLKNMSIRLAANTTGLAGGLHNKAVWWAAEKGGPEDCTRRVGGLHIRAGRRAAH